MKKALLLCLLLGLVLGAAQGAGSISVAWREGEMLFPDSQEWTYRYTYRYPDIRDEGPVAEALRHYFDLAFNEMTRLVLPMYAQDPIMTQDGRSEVREVYELTCLNDSIASFLNTHTQTVEGLPLVSLRSVVFAVSGEYAGDSLTLRGVARVGESSAQLGEAVLQDVWRQLEAQRQEDPEGFKSGLTQEHLRQVFYPESAFYADEQGALVFYIQPGDLRDDDQLLTYRYTPQQLEALIGEASEQNKEEKPWP